MESSDWDNTHKLGGDNCIGNLLVVGTRVSDYVQVPTLISTVLSILLIVTPKYVWITCMGSKF